MKKLFLLLLVLSLVLVGTLTHTTGRAAAEHHNDVVIELEQSFDGEEMTVVARMNENDGFVSMSLRVEFDASGMYLESVKHGDAFKHLDPTDNLENVQTDKSNALLVLYVGVGENDETIGELFTMKFHTKEGVANGKHTVSLYVTELSFVPAGGGDPWLNEKYSTEDSPLDHAKTGGVVVAETEYFISNGTPAASLEEGADHTLVIVLAVLGSVLVLAGIVLAAYFAYRKKGDDTTAGSIGTEKNSNKKA